MNPIAAVVLVLAAYLIGALPFGLFVARWFGKIDIRKHGSGNIGATNVGRVMGFRWFVVVFLLDALKGLLPTLAATAYVTQGFSQPAETWLPVLAGLMTILGHMFPCYLKFRGGKGVATALGVVLILAPVASAIAAVVFGLSFAIWRTVSISSILASLCFGITQMLWLKPHPFTSEQLPLGVFSLVVPALIVYRHRSNIARLLKGEENAFKSR
ncbi:glycerol-3-phosphate 1-O-acyltransferase PlsY [Rubinisphaera brasiliensis]|uniref:Glycerol-3-phosphate acyltransferase n=1 Tax=Rubinisphaera brasiliensis (strain ATCC 49424 / DSM 5305 / JCM 21570 / IAM 15109 / NBRC 103401 / IFAM 1448) TaxID=756272 RepID=F0SME0_RUBBR|nr:glycerol-3-phosphate 1-O-acyltransferase PlsY [Rubinisphaera brasiliensis]ADY62119.1 Glycerol-3-phosphate acyltransferase [Rubinisphaera brasiliensis DSM 5305]